MTVGSKVERWDTNGMMISQAYFLLP